MLPLFIACLVVSSLTPPAAPGGGWSGTLALLPEEQAPTTGVIFRALEHVAAFTLIGYAIAEYQGRSRDRFRTIAPSVLAWVAVSSAVLELARGWHPAHGASATMFALTMLGGGFGGWLYLLQLAHVRALTARP